MMYHNLDNAQRAIMGAALLHYAHSQRQFAEAIKSTPSKRTRDAKAIRDFEREAFFAEKLAEIAETAESIGWRSAA
jgi:hypothetical protein